jgi:hypothetical protein
MRAAVFLASGMPWMPKMFEAAPMICRTEMRVITVQSTMIKRVKKNTKRNFNELKGEVRFFVME